MIHVSDTLAFALNPDGSVRVIWLDPAGPECPPHREETIEPLQWAEIVIATQMFIERGPLTVDEAAERIAKGEG